MEARYLFKLRLSPSFHPRTRNLAFAIGLLGLGIAAAELGARAQQQASANIETAPSNGVIEGIVVDATTGEPLRNAKVSVSGVRRGQQRATTTGGAGLFKITDVPEGSLDVTASLSGYLSPDPDRPPVNSSGFISSLSDTVAKTSRAIVLMKAGGHVSEVRLRLVAESGISGKVLDERGEVLEFAYVELFRPAYDYDDGRPRLYREKAATADERGRYQFTSVLPGAYYLRVSPTTLPSRSSPAFMPVFYPGVVSQDQATTITAPPGQRMENIDLAVKPGKTYSVRLKLDSERPPSILNLQTEGSIRAPWVPMRYRTDADGAYVINGLWPGSYSLRLPRPIPFVVVDRDLDLGKLDATFPSVPISGRVIRTGIEQSDRAPHSYLLASRGSITEDVWLRSIPLGNGLGANSPLDSEGRFTAQITPGLLYRVQLNGFGDCPPSIRAAGTDVPSSGLIVRADQIPFLEIVIDNPCSAGVLEGIVHDARNNPILDAIVVLVPEPFPVDTRLVQLRGILIGAAEPGSFRFPRVPPGRYVVYAFEGLPANAQGNESWLAAFAGRGKAITVQPGMSSTVRLETIRVKQP